MDKTEKKPKSEYSAVWEIPANKLPNRAGELWGDMHNEFDCERKLVKPHSPYRLVPRNLENRL
jgi:hypothetical protein